jgi:hypothetical protein
MPLQDHCRPPLNLRRHWHAFHNAWATYLASHLNAQLPEGNGDFSLDIWEQRLELRGSLPTLPLWLRGEVCLPVELETTYDRTCREQKVFPEGVESKSRG